MINCITTKILIFVSGSIKQERVNTIEKGTKPNLSQKKKKKKVKTRHSTAQFILKKAQTIKQSTLEPRMWIEEVEHLIPLLSSFCLLYPIKECFTLCFILLLG